jgi:hypothetical protein
LELDREFDERKKINPSVASTRTNSMIGTNHGASHAKFIENQNSDFGCRTSASNFRATD